MVSRTIHTWIQTGLMIISIVITIWLAHHSLEQTYLTTSYVFLEVNDSIDKTKDVWYINITNAHPLKPTGEIYIYRLEKDVLTPHDIFKKGLNPGESYTFGLLINITEKKYFNETSTITAKILCDNCPSQGIIRQIREPHKYSFITTISNEGFSDISYESYSWRDFNFNVRPT